MKVKFKKVEVDGKSVFLSEQKIAENEAAKVVKPKVEKQKPASETPTEKV